MTPDEDLGWEPASEPDEARPVEGEDDLDDLSLEHE
jgi:hypothetical protein